MKTELEQQADKLQDQLDTLKAMIKKEQEPKKFEFEYQPNKTYLLHTDYFSGGSDGTNHDWLKHGRYRKTKEVAEQALALNMRLNRLHALAEQLGGLKEYEESHSYYIFMAGSVWKSTTASYAPERVYMNKDCAVEVCRMLNSGEFSLEG